jgi:hypothetical protein
MIIFLHKGEAFGKVRNIYASMMIKVNGRIVSSLNRKKEEAELFN